jgi:FAD-dependent oxidoreductase domain-containing protein 1
MTNGAAIDVVIIGAGVMGCATAVHLLRDEPGLRVTIIEPDTSYTLAATPRASGGVRQLFSCPENIAMSQYTLDVINDWRSFAGPGAPDLLWRSHGYLFVGADAAPLQASLEVQLTHRVRAEWLEPEQLAARFPQLAVGDLAGGVLSPDDGWLDPTALHQGMLTAARRLGARLLHDQAVGFDIARTRVSAVWLKSGGRLAAEAMVNAAGCWASELAARAGMPVPVEPMRRYEYYAEVREDLDGLPFVKDPAGLALRPQGPGISAGLVDFSQPGGFDLSVDHGYFERTVWPAVAHRFPRLDQLRLRRTSAGLYDQNRLDGNMIIGNHPGRLDNFYLACGFSGHGLMHAPAAGRALAELIRHGEYRAIDLTRMGYQRILDSAPYAEAGIR